MRPRATAKGTTLTAKRLGLIPSADRVPLLELTEYRVIRRFTDGSQEVVGESADVSDAHVGSRFSAEVPGKVWEVGEIIRHTEPVPTLIVVLVDEN